MEGWNQREEMNILLYLIRGGGENILIHNQNLLQMAASLDPEPRLQRFETCDLLVA